MPGGVSSFLNKINPLTMLLKLASITAITAFTLMPHDPLPDMAIGASMPAADQKMKDVSGKEITLKEAMGRFGVLVVFTCNTCPFVVGSEGSEGWEGRYPELASYAQRYGVGVVLVNSNEAKRADGDSFGDMQKRYTDKKYVGSYVLDAGNIVADAFGARTTPHVFLFNKDQKLVYKGAIDDNVGSAAGAKEHYVQNAIANMAEGRTIDPATTRNIGCSIKRVAVEHKH
jgi:hypothetical protein